MKKHSNVDRKRFAAAKLENLEKHLGMWYTFKITVKTDLGAETE